MEDHGIKEKTKKTAEKLFSGGAQLERPYSLWREFDRELANDLSLFITGNLYSREVLTIQERQMAAVAMLAALKARDELKVHANAALNVGCDPQKLVEIIFQTATYAGMPAVNEALAALKEVLQARGEWPLR